MQIKQKRLLNLTNIEIDQNTIKKLKNKLNKRIYFINCSEIALQLLQEYLENK